MRYQAPEHTSAVFAPSRPYYADDNGVIELPENASDADHAAMRSVGCVALPEQGPGAEANEAPAAPEGGADVPAKSKSKT